MKAILIYLTNIIWSLDILGNALMGGKRLEKISVRYGRIKHITGLCIFLNLFEKNHCEKSLQRWRKKIKETYFEILANEKKEFMNFGKTEK